MKLEDLKGAGIETLVPHAKPMLLLDKVTALDDEIFESEVAIGPDSEFCENGQVGAWVGVEYMAQTVAAFAGAEGKQAGEKIKIGFLLGTREYSATVPHFKAGSILRIRVKKVLHDPKGLSVVECSLRDASSNEELAKANLTVFQVEDFDAYLRQRQNNG